MPSGHSFIGYLLTTTTFESFVYSNKHHPYGLWVTPDPGQKYDFKDKFSHLLKLTLHASLQILLMFSRLYLGMHSLDQVLAGLLIGWYSHLLYNTFFRKLIHKKMIISVLKPPRDLSAKLNQTGTGTGVSKNFNRKARKASHFSARDGHGAENHQIKATLAACLMQAICFYISYRLMQFDK